MLLNMENVAVAYGGVKALKGVSMTIAEGEITTIIGPNGAGKSTLLQAISGLVSVAAGQITYMGRRIDGLKPDRIVEMGVIHVPERCQIFPRMTVRENLDMGAYLRRDREETEAQFKKVFEWFPRLNERTSQVAGSLSGGEQQMLALGRGLMAKPKILMLDEPSFGLAPIIVKEIAAIIQMMNKKEGITILLIEQNAKLALTHADKAYLIENGEIVTSGKGIELLENEHVKRAYLGV